MNELIEPVIDEVEAPSESTIETELELEPGPAVADADANEVSPDDFDTDDTDELKLKRIAAAEKLVRFWSRKLELAKLRAKAAKSNWENACGELQRVIRDETDPEPNLFNRDDDDDGDDEENEDEEIEEEPAPGGGPSASGGAASGGEEAWRVVKLAAISLAPAIVDKLAAAGIDTVGALSDYLKPNNSGFCKQLTDIAGVGEKKAEQIEAALDQFWVDRAMPKHGEESA